MRFGWNGAHEQQQQPLLRLGGKGSRYSSFEPAHDPSSTGVLATIPPSGGQERETLRVRTLTLGRTDLMSRQGGGLCRAYVSVQERSMQSHLTDAQLSELRSALWERYTELREEIRQELLKQENEQFVELAGQVHDAEEESVASLLVDLNLATLDRHVQELNEVEAALVRMREG